MTTNTETVGDASAISNIPEPFDLEKMRAVELPEGVTELSVHDIVLDDDSQVRRYAVDPKKIMDLAHDIARQGQLQPILYRVIGGKNIVVDGANRVRAIAYSNDNGLTKKKLKVKALLVDLSDLEAFAAGAAANIKRFEMSPIDNARVISVMVNEHGLTKTQVGKILGRSPAWVTETSQMSQLRAPIQKKIHEGKIGYTTARELLQMAEDAQDEYLAELEKDESGGKKRGTGRSREKLRKKRREKNQKAGGGETDARACLTMRETRELLMELGGVGKTAEKAKEAGEEYECKYSDKVQTVALAVLKALDGKLGEKALANKIEAA